MITAQPNLKVPSAASLAWMLGWNDCTVLFRSRSIVVFVVAMPLAMVLITGLAFKGLDQPMAQSQKLAADGEGPAAETGEFSSSAAHFDSFTQAVMGNGVLFILMNCVMSGGMGLVQERR